MNSRVIEEIQGQRYFFRGLYRNIVTTKMTQTGSICIIELQVPPHTIGALPHVHEAVDEVLFVLDGELTLREFHLDTEHKETFTDRLMTYGFAAVIPSGTKETFINNSDDPVTALVIFSPGANMDECLAELGEPADEKAAVEDAKYQKSRTFDEINEIASKYGMYPSKEK